MLSWSWRIQSDAQGTEREGYEAELQVSSFWFQELGAEKLEGRILENSAKPPYWGEELVSEESLLQRRSAPKLGAARRPAAARYSL